MSQATYLHGSRCKRRNILSSLKEGREEGDSFGKKENTARCKPASHSRRLRIRALRTGSYGADTETSISTISFILLSGQKKDTKDTKRRENNTGKQTTTHSSSSNNFVWARGSAPRGESAVPWVLWAGGSARVGSNRRDGVADYSTLFGRLRRPRHRASGGSPRSSKTRRDRLPSITAPLAQSFLCLFMVGQVVH